MTGVDILGRLGAPPSGLRRFQPGRDLSAVVRLLEEGFKHDLEAADLRWLAELEAISSAGPFVHVLLRLVPATDAGFTGFVWYEDGQLVGNVSLVRSAPDVWVIANVVTAPAYRRRGIGRCLMDAAIGAARARGAEQVQLQVRSENLPAKALYLKLGFWHMNTAAVFRLADVRSASARTLTSGATGLPSGAVLARWGRGGARQARRLVERSDIADRGGPAGPVQRAIEGHGLSGWLEAQLQGRRRYQWAAVAGGEFRAVAAVATALGGAPHRLELVVEPRWRGYVEIPLVTAAVSTLAHHMPAQVEADVDIRETGVLTALELMGFRRVRTLDRLALDLVG